MDRGHGDDHDVDFVELHRLDDDHDGDHDNDHGDCDDDHDNDHGDDGVVDLVVLLRIGSWGGMPARMSGEREVERTVGSLQTVHWS